MADEKSSAVPGTGIDDGEMLQVGPMPFPAEAARERLRDEFACAALSTMRVLCIPGAGEASKALAEDISRLAYEIADAMLKVREVKDDAT